MLEALEFEPYPDALPALAQLAEDGHVVVIVSNWDVSLPDWLGPPGLLEHVTGVATSAEVGAAKPDPRVFARGLELAGARPEQAVHVGDSLENDVAGARALGIRAVLVARDGPAPEGVEAVSSLTELPALL
jgi:putative hydrolase of the HAD superfamily